MQIFLIFTSTGCEWKNLFLDIIFINNLVLNSLRCSLLPSMRVHMDKWKWRRDRKIKQLLTKLYFDKKFLQPISACQCNWEFKISVFRAHIAMLTVNKMSQIITDYCLLKIILQIRIERGSRSFCVIRLSLSFVQFEYPIGW